MGSTIPMLGRQGAIAGAVAFIFRATIISGEGVSLPGIPSTVFVYRLPGFISRMRGTPPLGRTRLVGGVGIRRITDASSACQTNLD